MGCFPELDNFWNMKINKVSSMSLSQITQTDRGDWI